MGKVRKSIYFIGAWILCSSNLLFAQTPPNGLEGEALRNWIRDEFYVSSHRTLPYSLARDSVLAYVDNRNDTIFCVYGGYPYYWPKGYVGEALVNQNDGNILDLEHTIPQSFYDEAQPMVSDLHHLFPTLHIWNSTRSNYPFTEIPDAKTTKWMRLDQERSDIPFTYLDDYSELYDRSFEPREDHKGNCARAIFYFFTVYPRSIYHTLEVDINAVCDVNTLFQWHIEDPVDSLEILRNNHIEQLQGNRNPFIDHPEWIVDAWNINKTALPAPINFSLLERPSSVELRWDDLEDEIRYYLYRSTDQTNFIRLASIPKDSTRYNDEEVELETTYYYYLVGFNGAGNSMSTEILSGKRADRNTFVDIFFSEYIEGSSINKALEIANFTGTTVDLSAYSIKTQKNGSGIWEGTFTLNGLLENEKVWIVANSQADVNLLNKADTSLVGDIVSFNGNDVLGLFKNNELIDIIGYELGSNDFGKNVTLVRDPSIFSPNIVYEPTEWQEFPRDDFSHLGNHIITNIFGKASFRSLEVFPNPAKDKLVVTLPSISELELTTLRISIFTQSGKGLSLSPNQIKKSLNHIVINLDNIPAGIYILSVYNSHWLASQRFITH